MMLAALHALAEREGLLEDPNYEPRRIDLIIKIKKGGQYLGIVPSPENGLSLKVPRMETRTVGVSPGFLVDNSKYVLGLAVAEATAKDIARVSKCNAAFRELVQRAVQLEKRDPALQAVLAFEEALESNLKLILKDRVRSEWTGSENIAFEVSGDWAHESPGARRAWAAIRNESTSSLPAVRCLVTGKLAAPELKHPPIKRVPGTQQAQTMLVSFNAAAFTSMGFEQAQNAPVSREGAEGYVSALNALLRAGPGEGRRYAGGIGLGADSVLLVWTREKTPELDSLLDAIDARTADGGLEMVAAPMRGVLPGPCDDTDFFAVCLGGNAARVVVRDWFQTTFGVVKSNVQRWFTDLEVAGQRRPPALWQLLGALDPPGRASAPPNIGAGLGRSALFGGRVPLEILRHALLRLRVPVAEGEGHLFRQRVALIKLVLIRSYQQEVSVALDEAKTDVPYLLGRLFAVLERLQAEALGDVNATIRDRYFGAASSTPANVFPRLLRLSVHHVSKSQATWLEAKKSRIVDQLPAEPLPQTLTLESQGLFAVGYYHQRESFFVKQSRSTEAKEVAT